MVPVIGSKNEEYALSGKQCRSAAAETRLSAGSFDDTDAAGSAVFNEIQHRATLSTVPSELASWRLSA
jgi:hypothetical protein